MGAHEESAEERGDKCLSIDQAIPRTQQKGWHKGSAQMSNEGGNATTLRH